MDDPKRRRNMMIAGVLLLFVVSCCCCSGLGGYNFRHDIMGTIHSQQYDLLDSRDVSAGESVTFNAPGDTSALFPDRAGRSISQLSVACDSGTFDLTVTPSGLPPETFSGECDGFRESYVDLSTAWVTMTVTLALSSGSRGSISAYATH